jgi:DNA-binding transcriptional ArsR family regulator
VLRIHFTGADLARTRVLREPDPMWETTLSMHVLRRRCEDPLLAGWRQQSHRLLAPQAPIRERVDLLFEVNEPLGDFPDFLTPWPPEREIDAGLEQLRSTPSAQLRREVTALGTARGRLSPAATALSAGRPAAVAKLSAGMRAYFDTVVAPRWDWVRNAFDADQRLRAQQLLSGGLAGLLDGLHPAMRFIDGALCLPDYPTDGDLHLEGRGLVLIPSFFKMSHRPITLIDEELPPVLVYPVDRRPGVLAGRRESLSALVGRGRAAVLELCVLGDTTSGIARKLGMSAAGVSEHLTVLRGAGLVTSDRDRNSVVHALSPLGRTLLDRS